MKHIFISIIFCFLFSNCQERKTETSNILKKEEVVTMNTISNYDSIVNLVKTKGDTLAFDELFYFLIDSNEGDRTDTLMYYSKIMAEKYNYKNAYIKYLDAFSQKYNINSDIGNYSTLDISSLKKTEKEQIEKWLKEMRDKRIITKEEYNSVKR